MATSEIDGTFTFTNGHANPTHSGGGERGFPEQIAQWARDAGIQIDDEPSLVDVVRAREQGASFREAAVMFSLGLEYFEELGHNLYRRSLLGPNNAQAHVHYPREDSTREMIMLASNNYLGLTTHPQVVEASCAAAKKYGTGTASSPLLVGSFPTTTELERNLADFKSMEEACLFSQGFAANIGVISAVCSRNDLVVLDRLAHASILDGAKISGAAVRVFRHNDVAHLDKVLSRHQELTTKLVAVEGIYSMDGDMAPLDRILEVVRKHDAILLVDDAHSTGILGPEGRGAVAHFGLQGEVDLIVGTLSKSLAACGGFVAGPTPLVTYIRYMARANMFSAGISPMVAAAANAALNVIRAEPQLRERLWDNCRFMFEALKRKGFRVGEAASPVIPIIVGSMSALREMTLELHRNNVCVNSVPYPAVARGSERLRISLMATHTTDQLEEALDRIEQAGKAAGVI